MLYTHPVDIWIMAGAFIVALFVVLVTWAFTTLGKPPAGSQAMYESMWRALQGEDRDDAKPNIVTIEMELPHVEVEGPMPEELRELYAEDKHTAAATDMELSRDILAILNENAALKEELYERLLKKRRKAILKPPVKRKARR